MSIFNFLYKFRKVNHNNEKYSEYISSLEKLLGYKIENIDYYLKALTHRSYLEEEDNFEKSNERLEYLGDAVLDLVVGEYLFNKFPDQSEGFLTKKRSQLVDKQALYNAAEGINLKNLILYNKKFLGKNSQGLKTIIADAMEALIGAIYLDKGLTYVSKFTFKHLIEPSYISGDFKKDKNFKGRLLELTHVKKLSSPEYKIVHTEGPEHDKTFVVDVLIDNIKYGEGVGKNKKSAEQMAAKKALEKLNN